MTVGVEIVEVGMRDGFQSVEPFIPTATKIAILHALYEAGVRRIEATSIVSPSAVPQLADAAEVIAAANALSGLRTQILVPTARHAERALAAGARELSFVLSVSGRHNQSNVRRSPAQSIDDYVGLVALTPDEVGIRLNIATAFDCPYEGPMPTEATLRLLEPLVAAAPHAEVALCDTTGRVTPNRVSTLFDAARAHFPQARAWAYHGHDTFGLGAVNVLAAWHSGVRIFDASVAGLGGCPFAPGATGNVATEDLVWMFDGMEVPTGIDLDMLATVAGHVASLPGAKTGGRVRDALQARNCAG